MKRTNSLFPSIPSFFDDFFTRDVGDWLNTNFSDQGTTLPAVNIGENEEAFTVELAAPGMSKKDFNIELENNVLTISSEKKEEHEENDQKNNYFRKEFNYMTFQRSFRLPEEVVDAEKIKANYDDGILRLVLPKVEAKKTKPRKQITIH